MGLTALFIDSAVLTYREVGTHPLSYLFGCPHFFSNGCVLAAAQGMGEKDDRGKNWL
jgi:hypothetical protein